MDLNLKNMEEEFENFEDIDVNPEDIENFFEMQRESVLEAKEEAETMADKMRKIFDEKTEPCECPRCQCQKCKSRNMDQNRRAILIAPCVYRMVDEWICRDCHIVWKEELGEADYLTEQRKAILEAKKKPPVFKNKKSRKVKNLFND